MPDGDVPVQRVEYRLVEDLRDQAHVLVDDDPGAVTDRDARGLLAAVLKGVQAEVRELGHVLARGPDAEDAAGVPRRLLASVARLADVSRVADARRVREVGIMRQQAVGLNH